MFSIEHLNTLRAFEIDAIAARLKPGARVLEIGAGTGKQALELSRRGFKVAAIEIAAGRYDEERVFDIVDYDGSHIPFPERSFDVVYSSNVLEHVRDLEGMHREIRRVLRPDGYCLHVLPTDSWRFWTTLSAFPAAFENAASMRRYFLPGVLSLGVHLHNAAVVFNGLRKLGEPFGQKRHGERGNLITEIWYFRPAWWRTNFRRNGFEIVRDAPAGLFYTGNMIMNKRWSMAFRQKAARVLGSACHIFELKALPTDDRVAAANAAPILSPAAE